MKKLSTLALALLLAGSMTSAFAKKAPKPADSTDTPVATEKTKKAPKAPKKAGKKAAKKSAEPAPAGESQPQQ